MEVILKTLQLDTIALLVKQANGGSFQVVVIICLVFHNKLVLAAFLVVFQLLLWINIGVAELEIRVFEVLKDRYTGLKVDWCLFDTITDGTFLLLLE